MITDYTSYDEIRAALGVTPEELEDATLALPIYDHYLTMELEEVNIDLPTTYATVKAVAGPSEAQQRFLNVASMFATFAVAKQLTGSLPLFAAKQVTDSKAGVTRFDSPYKDTVASIKSDYERMRNRLSQALSAIGTTTGTAAPRVFMSVVNPSPDPVTGA